MSTSANGANAQGFLLLTLPNCTVSTPTAGTQTGNLALQCITLDVPSPTTQDRDVWLVLKLNTFEMAISPTQMINYSRSTYTYMFLPEDERTGPVHLTVPPNPSNPASYEDLETMEVILSQYGVVHDMESAPVEKEKAPSGDFKTVPSGSKVEPSDLKGRLVLMDEDDGEVVATLDDAVPIKEDRSLAAYGHEKDPVVVDLPGEEEQLAGHREAYAHPASPEEQDMLMKTAGLISRGIVLATSAVASGMTSASNYYISHSTASSKPVEFSPRARANIKRIHKISGTAVTVTSKTTSAILKTLDHVAGRLGGPSTRSASGSRNASQSNLVPPPLPRRPGSPGMGGSGTPPIGRASSPTGTPPPLPQRKPRLLNRLLASTDLLITTLEHSAKELIESGTDAVSASLTHRYGQDVGDASRMTGQSVRNVGLVYIDVRGVGRRALLKRAGKAVVKARMGGRDVVLGPQSQAQAGQYSDVPSGIHSMPPPPEYSQIPNQHGGSNMPGGFKS